MLIPPGESIVKHDALFGPVDGRADVGARAVPPAPVGVRSQGEAKCAFGRVLRGPGQLNHLIDADTPGVNGLQPGQGLVKPRVLPAATVDGREQVRCYVRAEDLVRDGQDDQGDVVQVLACSGGMTRKVKVTGTRRERSSGQRDRNSSRLTRTRR